MLAPSRVDPPSREPERAIMGGWRTLFGSATDEGTPEESRFPVSNVETEDQTCWVTTGLFPQVLILGSEKGDIQSLQRISVSSGDGASRRSVAPRGPPPAPPRVSQLADLVCGRAAAAAAAAAASVRRMQVSVCKEQSPSSRDDGWEWVEDIEMAPGARQSENLSVNTEARFVKFTILSGCAAQTTKPSVVARTPRAALPARR